MKFGFVGAGKIGGTLAKRLTALGHDVVIANSRGPETLAEVAADTGARAVKAEQAVEGRDIVVLTVPMKSVPKIAPIFAAADPATIVVDTCNYYPKQRDGRIGAIENGMTEARWVSTMIGRPVVKAFNNINWTKLLNNGRPKGDSNRIALPVSGDHPATKAKVMAVIDELGFDAVDAGGLDESWRHEPGRPCYGADLPKADLVKTLPATKPGRPADFSA
jgi:8-hydroxy-5-deazaflavin:NADPH oxidoreductase